MAVVGATGAILTHRAAELAHGHEYGLFPEVTDIRPESGDGLRKLTGEVGDLSLRVAFVDVMIPSADVGEGYFDAKVGFDELRNLFQAVTETSTGIIGVRGRLILRRISGLEHLHRVKGLVAGAMQHSVNAVGVHALEDVAQRLHHRPAIASADAEILNV